MTFEPDRPTPTARPRALNGTGEPDPVAPRHPGTPAGPAGPADPTIVSPAAHRAPDDGAEIRNPTQARQAAPAGRVRWVLVFGMGLLVIGFILAYFGTRP